MPHGHYTAFVMGTATWDRVYKKSGPPTDSKSVRQFRYEQAGGGAVNTRTAFGALANAYNYSTTVWACMKLGETGPNNHYKDRVLAEIGDHHLMDPAFREDGYTISDNDIALWNDPQDGSIQRDITKAQDDIDTPIYPGVRKEITDAVGECDVVILNSRFPEIAMIAAQEAKKCNIPIILDYAETNARTALRCMELIKMSDYVLADGHAKLLGMNTEDSVELRRRLVEEYGCPNVVVSDNRTTLRVYTDNCYMDVPVPMPDVPQIDNLGAGDVRDGAFGFYIADGRDFLTSTILSSIIASYSVGYPGRKWVPALPALINSHPGFANSSPDRASSEFSDASQLLFRADDPANQLAVPPEPA